MSPPRSLQNTLDVNLVTIEHEDSLHPSLWKRVSLMLEAAAKLASSSIHSIGKCLRLLDSVLLWHSITSPLSVASKSQSLAEASRSHAANTQELLPWHERMGPSLPSTTVGTELFALAKK